MNVVSKYWWVVLLALVSLPLWLVTGNIWNAFGSALVAFYPIVFLSLVLRCLPKLRLWGPVTLAVISLWLGSTWLSRDAYVQTLRTGAICQDGTTSSAVGSGACSHHGGVKRWIKQEFRFTRSEEEMRRYLYSHFFFGLIPFCAIGLALTGKLATEEPAPPSNIGTAGAVPPPFVPTPSFAEQVAASQKRAVMARPDLGKANSPLNLRYRASYTDWKARDDVRLSRPDWPERLADEAADA